MTELQKKCLLGVLGVLVFLASLNDSILSAESEEVEIHGIVYVVYWVDKYDDSVVVIAADDGEMYAVTNGGRGGELFQHEQRAVKAFGSLVMDQNGRKFITVYRYKLRD
jgi:hypothetical protein